MNRDRPLSKLRGVALVTAVGLVLVHPSATRGATSDPRVLRKEVTVPASLDDVWTAWTTSEGIASFLAPQSRIELRVGGAYELCIDPDAPVGQRGSEGCRVLSFLPKEMLSFEWLAPPAVPTLRDARRKTHVVLQFAELPAGSGRVRVTLTQLGWGDGEDWDQCYDYFDRAWGYVMGNLQKRFAPTSPPSDTPAPTTAPAPTPFERRDTSMKPSHLSPLNRLIDGVWHCKTQEPNGISLHAKLVLDWRIQKQAVIARSFLIHNGIEDLIHETMYVWHPQKKKIVFWSISAWGTLYEGEVVPEGDTLTYSWQDYRDRKVKSMQQTITFLNDDTYEWTVYKETDEGREQVQQATFRRTAE